MGDTELFLVAAVAVGLLYWTQRGKNGSSGGKTGEWRQIGSTLSTTFGPDTWDMESALDSMSEEWEYQTASGTGTISLDAHAAMLMGADPTITDLWDEINEHITTTPEGMTEVPFTVDTDGGTITIQLADFIDLP